MTPKLEADAYLPNLLMPLPAENQLIKVLMRRVMATVVELELR